MSRPRMACADCGYVFDVEQEGAQTCTCGRCTLEYTKGVKFAITPDGLKEKMN